MLVKKAMLVKKVREGYPVEIVNEKCSNINYEDIDIIGANKVLIKMWNCYFKHKILFRSRCPWVELKGGKEIVFVTYAFGFNLDYDHQIFEVSTKFIEDLREIVNDNYLAVRSDPVIDKSHDDVNKIDHFRIRCRIAILNKDEK